MISPAKRLFDGIGNFVGVGAADVTLNQLSNFLINELASTEMILFVMEQGSRKMIAASVDGCTLNQTTVTQFTADDNPNSKITLAAKELASGADDRDAYAFGDVWISTDYNFVRAVRVAEYHGMPLDSPWIFVEVQPANCDAGYELNTEKLQCDKVMSACVGGEVGE